MSISDTKVVRFSMKDYFRSALMFTMLLPVSALADRINFTIAGTLQDGGTASGTIEVDTLNGYVDPSPIMVFDGGKSYTFLGSFFQYPYQNTNPLEYYSTSYDSNDNNLLLSFPTLLKGYQGGALCSTSIICQGFTSSFTSYNGIVANKQEFTTLTASAAPEPSSLVLLVTGVLSAFGVRRYRSRLNAPLNPTNHVY